MKTNETKPGWGGRRTGAGRKADDGSRRALLAVRVTEQEKARVIDKAAQRGITPAALVQEWISDL